MGFLGWCVTCCGKLVVKIILFVLNIIIFIFGIALIALGALLYKISLDYADLFKQGDESVDVATYSFVLMAVGGVICIVVLCGCCALCMESLCLIYLYIACLIVFAIVSIAVGFVVLFQVDTVLAFIDKHIAKFYNKEYENIPKGGVSAGNGFSFNLFDAIQMKFECCGVNSSADYRANDIFKDDSVPISCCVKADQMKEKADKIKSDPTAATTCLASEAHDKGCATEFKMFVREGLESVAIVAIVKAIVEGVAVLGACCVIVAIKAVRLKPTKKKKVDK